jgi:hypothetical protein
MLRTRHWLSTLSLLWAVLQFALPTGVSYLDAAAASRSSATPALAHVEDGPGQSCQPPHSAECAVCRYLSTYASDPAHQPSLEIRASGWHVAPTGTTWVYTASIEALPLCRAPPVV